MNSNNNCSCPTGVVGTGCHTANVATAPFLRKSKSARLLLSFALVFSVMLFANAITAFAQCQASGSLSLFPTTNNLVAGQQKDIAVTISNTASTTPAPGVPVAATLGGTTVISLNCADSACFAAFGTTPLTFVPQGANGCVSNDPGVVSCTAGAGNTVNININSIALAAGELFHAIATIRVQANVAPTCAGTIFDRGVTGANDISTTTCTPNVTGGAQGSTSENFPIVCSQPTECQESNICNPATNQCVVTNKSDSTVCGTDGTPGDCKTPGCEAGVCVQAHNNVSDSTVCTSTSDIPGDCKTPGCEAGVCVAAHNNEADSTTCGTDSTPGDCKTPGCESGVCVQTHGNVANSTTCTSTDDITGDCGTPGCEEGVCVATHNNVADSTPCTTTADITGDCRTPGCESGACVATHNNEADSTACTETDGIACTTAGCEAGSCVQTHVDNCVAEQGCTPGFWKANADKKGANAWPVSPNTLLSSVFTIPPCLSGCPENYNTITLREALSLQGGKTLCQKAEILLRAAAAAYLNSLSTCVQYPISTGTLVAEVNTALASCDSGAIITEATRLDGFNNLGCPLNQQGDCSNP
jgi:hypothetical protein